MYWNFLLKMNFRQFFCFNFVYFVQIKAEGPILARKTLKTSFSFWKFLGLEHTLLSELPHLQNGVDFQGEKCLNQEHFLYQTLCMLVLYV